MPAFKQLYIVLWVFIVSVSRAITSSIALDKMNHEDIHQAAKKSANTLDSEIKKLNSRD